MAVKDRRGTRLLVTDEIDWIEAADMYVILHAGTSEYLYRSGIAAVASHLDPFHFVRIHRSSIVNLRSIAFLERRSHGEFEVTLKSGARLMLSRNYREQVESMLGQSL
jgi:two-component system LytT family response regulator